ncbi:PIN domain-containing protein [Mucisphaera sp.]|uniref:PIN domain-containing protein n=1 Tax=Mucisphaera sp. TaxID=2913024 RepID=UPI003D12F446
MSGFTVFFDTNVLVPGSVRDLLMQLATTGTFRGTCSVHVLEELRGVLSGSQGYSRVSIDHLIQRMGEYALDFVVEGYEPTMRGLRLPDPGDEHVLAAAVHAQADVIVTYNLKHFPESVLEPLGLAAEHPDTFVTNLLDLYPEVVVGSVHVVLERLKSPVLSPAKLLEVYEKNQLVATAATLRPFLGLVN